jgi:hypothetical protein
VRRHWMYLKYVLRHKWYVLLAGLQLKVPLLILIAHDWDKFLPSEWFPYARTFYNKDGSKTYNEHPAFTLAWNQHQKINKHHWQWWYITWDRGESEALPMPDVFRREMLADWRGAGQAVGFPDTRGWYEKNRDKMKLHPETRQWIEEQLGVNNPIPEKESPVSHRFTRFFFLFLLLFIAFLLIVPVSAQSPDTTAEPTAIATVAPVPPVVTPAPTIALDNALQPRDAAYLLVLALAFVALSLFGGTALYYVGQLAPKWVVAAGFQGTQSALDHAKEVASLTPNTIDDNLVQELIDSLNELHDKFDALPVTSKLMAGPLQSTN